MQYPKGGLPSPQQVSPGPLVVQKPLVVKKPLVVRTNSPTQLIGAFAAGVMSGWLARWRRTEASARPLRSEPATDRADADEPAETGTDPASRRPDADDPRKPQSPTDLTRPSRMYVMRQTINQFTRDQCMDLAAALTYYAILSLFPALLVMMSLLGVFGQGQRTSESILELVADISPGAAVDILRQPIEQLVSAQSAGFALVAGALGALWSASGYVGAFSRAMNRIYEVEEGRPGWKLRLQQLGLTLAGLIVATLVAFLVAVSGPVADSLGEFLGVGATGLTAWNIVRWPVLLALVILGVGMLYYVAPNVRQPRFRWVSVGAAIAIVTWVCASLLFGLYVSNFGNYNKTFGTLAGVIVFLLWVWITNVALLFGAEVDAELERGRELQAGIAAEEELQLPFRDTDVIDKNRSKARKLQHQGRLLRRSHGHRV